MTKERVVANPEELDSQDIPSAERSAEMYVDAVNAVIGLAGMAVPLLVPGGKAAAVAGAVVKAAPVIQGVANQLPKIAPVVAPAAKKVVGAAAEKAPDAVAAGFGKVAAAAKGAAEAAGGAAAGARNAVQGAIDIRAQEKARKLARRTLLDGAGIRMSSASFMENWDVQSKLQEGSTGEGYLNYCGCYVIITCDGAVHKDDYSKYREIYVGKSTDMGASIHDDFVGKGNADVYADVKYKQHVYVLLYPCSEDKLDQLEESLITALDADASYNRKSSSWEEKREGWCHS